MTTVKRGRGRPASTKIKQDEFEKLCSLQCTELEICAWFDVCQHVLETWIRKTYGKDKKFADVYAVKRGTGLISLRRSQFQLAQKNAAMAIFLGKNYLGQKDTANETRVVVNNSFVEALNNSAKDVWDDEQQ